MLNTWQKLATLLLRLAGLVLCGMGLTSIIFSFIWEEKTFLLYFASGLFWALFGLVLLALSRLLGRWIGRDLEAVAPPLPEEFSENIQ